MVFQSCWLPRDKMPGTYPIIAQDPLGHILSGYSYQIASSALLAELKLFLAFPVHYLGQSIETDILVSTRSLGTAQNNHTQHHCRPYLYTTLKRACGKLIINHYDVDDENALL